jgi:hypothetical protein
MTKIKKAEQIMRLKVGIGELLAFHSAVYEKADMERIPSDSAAYKVVEDIQDYSQLGSLKKEHYRVQQQIYMFNTLMANKQQAIMAMFRLQSMGINDFNHRIRCIPLVVALFPTSKTVPAI